MKRAFVGGCAFALMLSVMLLAYQRFGVSGARAAEKSEARSAPKIVLKTNALPQDTRGLTSFAPVVKRVAPSVVTIYSSKTVSAEGRDHPLLDDPAFRRFFGGPDEEESAPAPRGRNGRRTPRNMPKNETEQSLGSGVIVSADGYILSNNHVVEGADEVKVSITAGGEEFIAKVIGTDPQTDISVLKIDAKDLPPITMTDSDNLHVGDVVLAVGNPFGVGQTVTMGIVSATGRGQFGIVDYEDFIQTDAAINPGNSGGALVDAEGRLVGINTAIISRSGGSMGIGFAVPINMARSVMDSIIRDGRVTRGFLGLSLAPEITSSMAKKFALKDRAGALINDVIGDSPAGQSGIEPGDVVMEFNGRKVPDSRQLRLWVSQTPPRTKVSLKLNRNGKERAFNLTLAELPGDPVAGAPGKNHSDEPTKSEALDGVEVADMDARTRRQMGVPASVQGALVKSVEPGSTSATAGLQPGNVILEINRKKVKTAQEAIDLSETLSGDESILMRVWSGGKTGPPGSRYLVVEPARKAKADADK